MSEPGELAEELLRRLPEGQTAARLLRYVALLEQWSGTHNLVRFRDRRELLERHVLEALPLVAELPRRGTMVDVGSGAGLPGVPLLSMCPDWRGVLLEPRQKRWAFLRLVVRELELPATVVASRFQEWQTDAAYELITARAVGNHPALLRWARQRLAGGGQLVIFTGEEEAHRLELAPGWRVLSSALAGLERGRLVRLEPCFT